MKSKQNLVLIPGLMLDERMWVEQLSALAPLANITIPDRSRPNTIGAVADYILSVCPEAFALGGLSQGGVIALEIMRRAPERVTKLALLDTTHKVDTHAARQVCLDGIAMARDGKYDQVMAEFLPRLITPKHFMDETLVDALTEMARDLGPEGYVREQQQMLSREHYEDLLPRITVSTVVVCGAEDAFFSPEQHKEMAARISESNLVVIPDSGHMTTMEQPEAVNKALLGWLEG